MLDIQLNRCNSRRPPLWLIACTRLGPEVFLGIPLVFIREALRHWRETLAANPSHGSPLKQAPYHAPDSWDTDLRGDGIRTRTTSMGLRLVRGSVLLVLSASRVPAAPVARGTAEIGPCF